ncbi:unnamed protein product [Sphagnum jensenii]|uniref:CID domain-containing protein n=1 Tax=Sphagnum jensenii TaxID=128206 RepID=A0ABP0VY32_9BRYO
MDVATTSGGGAFTGSTLADKLSKLNASQQSIETLSHWCIFHRKKAKEVVETWGRKFREAPREQRVPFLYLANDILQNSRRKGLEFVNEFWTVLPPLLRTVVETGDEAVRNAAFRLVDIWEERKVFGSNVRNLREELLGKGSHPSVQDVKPSALPPYYVSRGMLERIARSYQAVQDNVAEEDAALANCNAAITRVESLQKKAENSTGKGEVQESIAEELLAQQVTMAQCIEQLETCEMSHAMLVSNLRDALHEQEGKLEQLRTHLQIAQAQLEQAGSVQHHLMTGSPSLADAIGAPSEGNSLLRNEALYHHHEKQPMRSKENGNQVVISSQSTAISIVAESNSQAERADNSSVQTSAATMAAEVAAKLAASSSSAAMLTSVLSSLAAEEASGGPHSPSYDVGGGRSMEKRARLDGRVDSLRSPENSYAQHQMLTPMSQYTGAPVMPLPYAYQSSLPPPPPLQSHMMTGHRIPVPPRPVPPGYGPPPYQPFPPSRTQFYNQPPLPAPPAPAPRQ